MLRSLFCAAAVFSLFLSICLIPQTVSARRCGGEMPETLLSLYQKSDAIYVASFDKLVEGEVTEQDENYSVQDVKKHFSISSALKGEGRKFLVLEDRNYIYKRTSPESPTADPQEQPENAEPVEEPEFEEEEDGGEVELKNGDTLILFVTNGDEGAEPALTHYSYGLKKLSMYEIGVYEARIKELNSIFAARKVNERLLLEWVIRCAEDPVTRWEGTFELLQSVRDREWREEEAKQKSERIERGEPVEEMPLVTDTAEKSEEEAEPDRTIFDTSVFAQMLDAGDKQRIANLLFQSGPQHTDSTEEDEPVAGNQELLELVKRWGDPRLMGFLLDKLRAGAGDPYSTSSTMSIIAEVLDDTKASELAARFEEGAYEDADAVVELGKDEEPGPEQTPAADAEKPVEPADEAPVSETEEAAEAVEKPVEKKRTYADLRLELIREFLARCDEVIAAKEQKKNEESEIRSTR